MTKQEIKEVEKVYQSVINNMFITVERLQEHNINDTDILNMLDSDINVMQEVRTNIKG